jgi:DNA-directed RNA polymerase beta subunit
MRREGKIHPRISIEYKPLDNGELHFHTDMGRMLQPLVIVYQNKNEVDLLHNEWPSAPFKGKPDKSAWQYVLFTAKHAMLLRERKITLDDLVDDGIIEWIAPDEYMDIMVCDSYDSFLETRDSRLHEYTHLGIPIAQLCVSILTTTFGNHSQPVRTVYNSKFVKQTVGFPNSRYGQGFWSKLPVRHHVYNTSVRTVSDNVYNHGATPVIVLVLADAENQEDSIILSDILSENGKFTADVYNSVSIELEIGHVLAVPDPKYVKNVRGTDFSHLHASGLPIRGSVIYPGMAIVGIIQQVSGGGDKIDKSSYHKKSYPIVIDHASLQFDNGQSQIIKVSYKTTSTVEEGDKFGAKSGCKGVASVIRRHCEMPKSKEGIIAEMIYNPSSVPTRMVAGQIMEGTLGSFCAQIMAYADATMYKKYNEADLDKLAAELGVSDNGLHIMYDGKSGRRIKGRLCIWHNGYQRINKLAADQSAVTNVSNINMITQQPEKSVARGGGQRLGYMEFDALTAHGCAETIRNIAFIDSDAKTYYICDTCKTFAGINPKKNIYQCNNCDETTFSRVQTTHAANLITGQMTMMGASVKILQKKSLAV